MQCSSAQRAPNSHIRINDQLIFVRQRQDKTFNKLNRKLAGMVCFFNVIVFHVRDDPDIAWVLTQRVAGVLTDSWTLKCLLAWIFLRNADWVQVESVFVSLGEPNNCLVPS